MFSPPYPFPQRQCCTSIRFRLAKQHLCTCTLFCPFLCRRWTTTTWNCLISRLVEDVTTNSKRRPFFCFPELCYSSLEFNSKKIHFWRIAWDGIRAIKFNAARKHFLTGVFVACLELGRAKIINERSNPREVSRLASLADLFFYLTPFFAFFPHCVAWSQAVVFRSRRCCSKGERAWPRATWSFWK